MRLTETAYPFMANAIMHTATTAPLAGTPASTPLTNTLRWLILATALVALANLFTALGDLPLSRVQEVRVAETAQEMLGRHEYLTPWFNGELRFQKPPLAYWLAIAGYRIFGAVHEFSLRFLTTCLGAGSLLLLFRFVHKHSNIFTACFSVLCMASCIIPLKMARVAETDTPLLFCIIAAVALGYELLYSPLPDRTSSLVFFVAMSIGMLSKGPPGIAIPLGLFLLTALINQNRSVMSRLVSPSGWILLLVIAGSWYAWMYLQHPDALVQTLQKETDDTYISGDHKQPVYYYLTRGIGYYAPWSLLVIPCAAWLWQQRATLPSLVHYALLWFALVFAMLSFNANKQAHYSLLLAPSFSILVGYYLQHAEGKHRTGIIVFCSITALACTVWNIHLLTRLPFHITYLIAFIVALLTATGIYKYCGRLPAIVLATSGMAALCITLTAIQKEALPDKALFDQKQLGQQVKQAGYQPLFFYPAILDEILFYAGGPIPELKNAEAIKTALQAHPVIYVFAAAGDAEKLTQDFNPSVIASNKHFRLLKFGAEP